MYIRVVIAKNNVFYTWNLLRDKISSVPLTQKTVNMWHDGYVNYFVVITSQCIYIYILKHYVLHLEYVQYILVNHTSIKWGKENQMQEINNYYKYAIYLNIAIIILNMDCIGTSI